MQTLFIYTCSHHKNIAAILLTTLNATLNNISVKSWWSVSLVEETGVHGENHWPVASNWQTLSHNVVLSKPRHEQDLEFTTLLVIGTNCTGTNVVVNQIFNILQVVRGGRPGDNLQYSRRHSVINHCDRYTTLLSETDISFGLFNLFTYFEMHFWW